MSLDGSRRVRSYQWYCQIQIHDVHGAFWFHWPVIILRVFSHPSFTVFCYMTLWLPPIFYAYYSENPPSSSVGMEISNLSEGQFFS